MKPLLEALLANAQVRLYTAQLDILRLNLALENMTPDLIPGARQYNEHYQRLMPTRMNPPAIPSYTIPQSRDCDLVVDATVEPKLIIDPSTGEQAEFAGQNILVEAYKAARMIRTAEERLITREDPIRIAVHGDAGTAWLGCSNSAHNRNGDDMIPGDIFLVIAGQTEDSRVELKFAVGNPHGYVHLLHVFNTGLYSGPDSFTIRANEGSGEIVFDGHWAELSESGKASFLHIDQYETLVLRNLRWRGTLYREHSLAYIKSSVGDPSNSRHGTWIVGNRLQGGNRTGFQIRPGAGDSNTWQGGEERFAPTTPVVIVDNFSDGYGWEHAGSDGGGAMTVWSNPNQPVYVFGNDIRDARYSCLVAAAQGWVAENQHGTHPAYNRDWLNANGHVILELHVFDNWFENDRSSRSAVSISGVEFVYLYAQQREVTDVSLDNAFAKNRHNVRNGTVYAEEAFDFNFSTGNEGTNQNRPLTGAELALIEQI